MTWAPESQSLRDLAAQWGIDLTPERFLDVQINGHTHSIPLYSREKGRKTVKGLVNGLWRLVAGHCRIETIRS